MKLNFIVKCPECDSLIKIDRNLMKELKYRHTVGPVFKLKLLTKESPIYQEIEDGMFHCSRCNSSYQKDLNGPCDVCGRELNFRNVPKKKNIPKDLVCDKKLVYEPRNSTDYTDFVPRYWIENSFSFYDGNFWVYDNILGPYREKGRSLGNWMKSINYGNLILTSFVVGFEICLENVKNVECLLANCEVNNKFRTEKFDFKKGLENWNIIEGDVSSTKQGVSLKTFSSKEQAGISIDGFYGRVSDLNISYKWLGNPLLDDVDGVLV